MNTTESNNSLEFFMKRFAEFGKEVIPGFRIDGENKAVIETLVQYLTRCSDFEKDSTEGRLNRNKGIILIGNYGSGKTGLFKIMQKINNSRHKKMKVDMRFGIIPAWKVATYYHQDGFQALEKYWSGNWCFDEIGKVNSEVINHYGTKVNVTEQIILERYNLFVSKGLVTHFTTNLSVNDLERHYDGRTISRLREMCNFIYLVSKKDRRLTSVTAQPKPYIPEKPPISRDEFYKDFKLKYSYHDALLKKEIEEPKRQAQRHNAMKSYINSNQYRISQFKAVFIEYCRLTGLKESIVREFYGTNRQAI